MSHQPPVPPAATPPYPPQPAPIAADQTDETAPVAEPAEKASEESGAESRSLLLGIGAAVGIGSAALLAATLYTRRGSNRRG